MKNLSTNNRIILQRIEREFSTARQMAGGGRLRYPAHLKKLVLESIKQGESERDVVRAAGISALSVWKWKKKAFQLPPPSAVELTLIPRQQRPQQEITGSGSESVARIRFRSGVILRIPISALTARLLSDLNDCQP